MTRILIAGLISSLSFVACSESAPPMIQTPSPVGWLCGSTGGGAPVWALVADESGGSVLEQSGSVTVFDDFNFGPDAALRP